MFDTLVFIISLVALGLFLYISTRPDPNAEIRVNRVAANVSTSKTVTTWEYQVTAFCDTGDDFENVYDLLPNARMIVKTVKPGYLRVTLIPHSAAEPTSIIVREAEFKLFKNIL